MRVFTFLLAITSITNCSALISEFTAPHGIPKEIIATTQKTQHVFKALSNAVSPTGMLVLGTIGYGITPLSKLIHNKRKNNQETESIQALSNKSIALSVEDGDDDSENIENLEMIESKLLHGAHLISHICKIGVSVYVVEYLGVIFEALGYSRTIYGREIRSVYAKVVYTLWASLRFRGLKKYFLRKHFHVATKDMGVATAYNVTLNLILYFLTFLFLLDLLQVEIGVALKSLFTFSGLGTLAITYASRDLATQLIMGLGLKTSGKFVRGEEILLGDGTNGTIMKVGWMETTIQGSNDIPIRIPNQHIFNQRISNLSRINVSQVKQTLQFGFEDISKLPAVIEDIKEEVIRSCPYVISRGKKPFRVHLREFSRDCAIVVVDVHLRVPPIGDIHFDKKQQVLFAITRAVERHGLQLKQSRHKND